MHFSPHIISVFCLLVTGIYGGAIDSDHGTDVGNNFCMGACKADRAQIACGPTQSAQFRAEKGCYMCCYSDDNVDDFADKL